MRPSDLIVHPPRHTPTWFFESQSWINRPFILQRVTPPRFCQLGLTYIKIEHIFQILHHALFLQQLMANHLIFKCCQPFLVIKIDRSHQVILSIATTAITPRKNCVESFLNVKKMHTSRDKPICNDRASIATKA